MFEEWPKVMNSLGAPRRRHWWQDILNREGGPVAGKSRDGGNVRMNMYIC